MFASALKMTSEPLGLLLSRVNVLLLYYQRQALGREKPWGENGGSSGGNEEFWQGSVSGGKRPQGKEPPVRLERVWGKTEQRVKVTLRDLQGSREVGCVNKDFVKTELLPEKLHDISSDGVPKAERVSRTSGVLAELSTTVCISPQSGFACWVDPCKMIPWVSAKSPQTRLLRHARRQLNWKSLLRVEVVGQLLGDSAEQDCRITTYPGVPKAWDPRLCCLYTVRLP